MRPKTEEEKRIEELELKLEETAAQLRLWAVESQRGGWSTHQVEPMRRFANGIDEIIYK